tara:strand:- start:25089 stop:25826 length:738 start_codon:yes stop_codon:yes gene_type:complete
VNIKTFSAESNPGPFLQVNEDGYDFDLINEVFILLDGFGGSGIGDVCVSNLKQNIKSFYTKFCSDPDATMPFYFSPRYLLEGNALINSLLHAHGKLYKENLEKEFSARAGSSGIFMAKAESVLTIVSVGNCACYLYRKGELSKIFIEDSFQFLTNSSYQNHLKTTPLSGIGLFPELDYQVKELRLFPGDKVIALSDGAYARLSEGELRDIVNNPEIEGKEKIAKLFSMSNQKGNLDNQSCMILEF